MAGGHALPGLSLFFASGLSSPGLLGCFALCLKGEVRLFGDSFCRRV